MKEKNLKDLSAEDLGKRENKPIRFNGLFSTSTGIRFSPAFFSSFIPAFSYNDM